MATAPPPLPPPPKQSALKSVGFPARTPPPPPINGKAKEPKSFSITTGPIHQAKRIGLFGHPGVGKTSLAALIENSILLDFEQGSSEINVSRIDCNGADFDDARDLLQGDSLDQFGTIIIDSATVIERLVTAWVLKNIKPEKGDYVKNIESFGYKVGFSHTYETFLMFMSDLDRHVRAGRNIVVIMHLDTLKKPNAEGEDYLCWEPKLQNHPNGNIRAAFVAWLSDLWFIDFDKNVDKKGKATGSGTRTIYPFPQPHFLAKSHTLKDAVVYNEGDSTIWNQLFKTA